MATVSLVSVSKYIENNCILNDINLHIEKGEFVAVVGPSGCGKSTLLRLVAGLDTVCEGNVLINDKCMNKIPAARRDMAMVFQNYALYPHMTVYDNMAYGLKMRKMKKDLINQRVEEVAELLQLKDIIHRRPTMLSGGQRQRVAMGRAIVRSPAVFLFDEPLSNLDAKLRTEMRHEIKKLHRQLNTTCLYVTHDQTEAMTLADRVVVLNKGNIEQLGTPSDLYQNPATIFVAGFIGHYPTNFLPAVVDSERQVLVTDMAIDLPLPKLDKQLNNGEAVIVGIRAEHLFFIPNSKTSEVKINSTHKAIEVKIEFIDDMGADKLMRVITHHGQIPLAIRVSGDTLFNLENMVIGMELGKANVYCQKTGKRLGGWNGSD